ncbi:DUF4267 domain-containing protein [Streptomyces sp. SKN60]|uniref:DUF4267 domain-containing protein n=1 Tax=Streptomyces sp. SKN60 TaxID=2855506 RepID=UPI002247524B|nr:DUF4267 domain-containing protein [Streptomyces sp. SKN60]MCX2181663.1 DUF4267 domain-containing protein [Streptomyces sp. SKN60]
MTVQSSVQPSAPSLAQASRTSLTHRAATVLAALGGLACLWFGIDFLFAPESAAAGFGIPAWPEGQAAGYFGVKAARDLANGAVILGLLALGRRRSLAWVMLLMTIAPVGDCLSVLSHGGSYAAALGIHAATAAAVLVTAGLLFATSGPERESGRALDRSGV